MIKPAPGRAASSGQPRPRQAGSSVRLFANVVRYLVNVRSSLASSKLSSRNEVPTLLEA